MMSDYRNIMQVSTALDFEENGKDFSLKVKFDFEDDFKENSDEAQHIMLNEILLELCVLIDETRRRYQGSVQ